MAQEAPNRVFTAALDRLVADVKRDRSILAAILCGSLSHDRVWAKSDIDLVLVTVDDKKIERGAVALYADGVNVHAILTPRTEFRRMVEGAVQNSFLHSLLAKGRLLYTHDETVARLCDGLRELGSRDRRLQLLRAGVEALPPLDKARKWLVTRGDVDYTALWILYAATPLAQIEVLAAGRIVDREVVPQALELNPPFFKTIYVNLLNSKKSRAQVGAALDTADGYIRERAASIFAPVLDYFRETGDTRGSAEIETHFSRKLGVSHVLTACEYLADEQLLAKVSLPVKLTKKSPVEMQELAFVHLGTRRTNGSRCEPGTPVGESGGYAGDRAMRERATRSERAAGERCGESEGQSPSDR